jgi:heptaprenylglyceryl phosphate synthase
MSHITSVQNKQNGISLGGTTGKDKTATGNLISKIRTNPSKKAYFLRGVSKILSYFGQQ